MGTSCTKNKELAGGRKRKRRRRRERERERGREEGSGITATVSEVKLVRVHETVVDL